MSAVPISEYRLLMDRERQIILLESAKSILHWDMETKMPPRGITLRSLQLAQMAQTIHQMSTSPELGRLLKTILNSPGYDSMDSVQKRNVYLVKRRYDEATALPEELVAETARQEAVATDVWKKAKAARDFSIFRPELDRLIELKRRAAELLRDVKQVPTPYDALIDLYEPGVTSAVISKLFEDLQSGLTELLRRYVPVCQQVDTSPLHRRVPVEVQKIISNRLVEFLGYDVNSKSAGGRIDETEHPFTSGYYDDVRITTHYYEDNFSSSIFSTLHEAGHAMYDQGLNPEWVFQPVGSPCSLGIHESQSRFVENIVGRSLEFWSYFLPKLKELTGATFQDLDVKGFTRLVNIVRPSKIRIEADEVTYSLHVIIRFELEKEIVAGNISTSELPDVWNQKYKDYLDVTIEHDSEGVMQDTHWASGLIGYFPTYALGNIYSGQILAEMEKSLPEWRTQVSQGDFSHVKRWMTENVYRYGNLYDPVELVRKITEQDVTVKPFIDYLKRKYREIYP